jgi:hypothetical protein
MSLLALRQGLAVRIFMQEVFRRPRIVGANSWFVEASLWIVGGCGEVSLVPGFKWVGIQ